MKLYCKGHRLILGMILSFYTRRILKCKLFYVLPVPIIIIYRQRKQFSILQLTLCISQDKAYISCITSFQNRILLILCILSSHIQISVIYKLLLSITKELNV